MCFLAQYGFDKLAMCDNRRFAVRRCGGRDERHATCDVRATIDASMRDKKHSRTAKQHFVRAQPERHLPS